MLHAALCFVLYARQQTTTHHHQHSSNNQQQQQSPNYPKQGQRNNQGTKEHGQTRRPGRAAGKGGAVVLDHQAARPCLVSCVLPKRKRRGPVGRRSQHSRSVGLSTAAAHLPATRVPLNRREEPVPCETPAPMSGVWLMALETAASSLTLARRRLSPRSTRPSSCLVAGTVPRYTRPLLRLRGQGATSNKYGGARKEQQHLTPPPKPKPHRRIRNP